MPNFGTGVSRREFLIGGSALLLTAGLTHTAGADPGGTALLQNDLLAARFDLRGLIALQDRALAHTIPFADDGYSLSLDQITLDSASLPAPVRTQGKNMVVFTTVSVPYTVKVVYELRPGWRFVSKQIFLETSGPAPYRVKSVTPFRATLGEPVARELLTRGGSFGAFLRFGAGAAVRYGMFFVIQNPFMQWKRTDQKIAVSYVPDMDWKSAYGPFAVDRVCLGPYRLSGHGFPLAMVPEWQYQPDPKAAISKSLIRDIAEWQAMTDCVRAFLLYQPKKSVRIDIGWCENDYQIDMATPHGQAQYRRMIAQSAAMGCKHFLYTPANTLVSSKAESVDAWAWENILWLGMGQKIRKGEWSAAHGVLPPSIKTIQDYAATQGVSLAAYVYPSMKWRPEWNVGDGPYGGASSANREFQDWFIEELVSFQKNTGIGGYSFDYWWLGYKEASLYAQWHGCRRILESLRTRLPNVLIDGRQSYQNGGPWAWLAGTYPHPTTTDEQPESFPAFPDLHVDRVYGNRQRWAAWWYRMENFCPTEILPGFITHQTERFDSKGDQPLTDFRTRDWDYLGWKFSALSSIATAPMNHVLNFIPARDESEFTHFSEADKKWLRDWLDWTDTHVETLRQTRPILGEPRLGCTDGTAAISGDRGFIFLFNPNQRAMPAEFVLDESIGLTKGLAFTLTGLHPYPGLTVGKPGAEVWHFGDIVSLMLDGTQTLVLELAPAHTALKAPQVQNVTGQAAVVGRTLALTQVRGPIGQDVDVQVIVPGGKTPSALTVNGVPVAFKQLGNVVQSSVRFAGTRFGPCQPVLAYDPAFTGGTVQGNFKIPGRIFEQLRRRKAAWPIPYTEDDLRATWLGPHRLLLYVQIAEPKHDMALTATLDGSPVTLKESYTSIYPRGDGAFVGWYLDISDLVAERSYAISLTLPKLQPGQFQGIFFENVETEQTALITPAKIVQENA